jgi:hypothetical protein
MWGSLTFLHETILNGNTTTIIAEASPLKHTLLHLFLVEMVIVNGHQAHESCRCIT